jgi:hypothetical protein
MQVPPEVVEALGAGKRPPVKVTIGRHTWRSTIAVYGGRYFLGVSAENRDKAGIAAGEIVIVTVALDAAPRTVTVPPDLARALKKQPGAQSAFAKLSYTHQREHVEAIQGAKKPETRQRRIEKALAMLESRAGTRKW